MNQLIKVSLKVKMERNTDEKISKILVTLYLTILSSVTTDAPAYASELEGIYGFTG